MATIQEKGYGHWDGRLIERRLPWWPITRTAIRMAFRTRHFKFFFSGAFIPAIVYLVGIYVSERLDDFRFMIKGSEKFLVINPGYFKSYLTGDFLIFMMVLLMVFSGAGLIADDLKFNALQLYFARPLKKKDYLLGKAAVVGFFVLLLTLIPAVLFIIFKLIFSGNFEFLTSYPWLPASIAGYSLLITAFFACYTLLLSALSKNRRYVAIMIFAVYFFSDIIFGIFNGIFNNPYFSLLSLKANIQQIGAVFFGQKPPFDVPWPLSLAVLVAVCVLAGVALNKRIRGVEVIR